MKILVCGAGYVGSRVAKLLSDMGYEVEVLRKSKEAIEGLKTHSIDMREEQAALGGFDVIYLCLSPGEFSEEAYRKTFIDAYRNILNSVDATKLKKIIMVSSTSVYSQNESQWVYEEDASPSSFSGKVLLESEKLIAAFGKDFVFFAYQEYTVQVERVF